MAFNLLLSFSISVILLFLNGCLLVDPDFRGPPRLDGIASHYFSDDGIEEHPDVIFFDGFEQWDENGSLPPQNTWGIYQSKESLTRVVDGRITVNKISAFGDGVIEVACWSEGGESTGGLYYKIGNYDNAYEGLGEGNDEVFVRYYIKFDIKYRLIPGHGVNIGGRDVTMKNAYWVGMAGVDDVSSVGYFFSGLEPAGVPGDNRIEFDIYSYNLDKRGVWGEYFQSPIQFTIDVGIWHSVERHIKLNTVDPATKDGNYDGIEEVWIDGKLTHRIEGIRYRRVDHLKITFLSLETYYQKGYRFDYDRMNPIKVYFDNVVIARKYIGPINLTE